MELISDPKDMAGIILLLCDGDDTEVGESLTQWSHTKWSHGYILGTEVG